MTIQNKEKREEEEAKKRASEEAAKAAQNTDTTTQPQSASLAAPPTVGNGMSHGPWVQTTDSQGRKYYWNRVRQPSTATVHHYNKIFCLIDKQQYFSTLLFVVNVHFLTYFFFLFSLPDSLHSNIYLQATNLTSWQPPPGWPVAQDKQ